MALKLVTAPESDPITVVELRSYLKIGTDEDTYLGQLIKAATLHIEKDIKQRLVIQTWKQTYHNFPETINLELSPVREIISVKYYDIDGTLTTMDSTDYSLDLEATPVNLTTPYPSLMWPYVELGRNNAVEVVYTVGYDIEDTIALALPEDLKQALLLLCGHWFANREPVVVGAGMVAAAVPQTLDYILTPHRTWLF